MDTTAWDNRLSFPVQEGVELPLGRAVKLPEGDPRYTDIERDQGPTWMPSARVRGLNAAQVGFGGGMDHLIPWCQESDGAL